MTRTLDSKPIIAFIHGAWHRPLHYIYLLDSLRAAGYSIIAPQLPGTGWSATVVEATPEDNVKAIHHALGPYVEAGREIVMVCHSLGGFAATDSCVGWSVKDRRGNGKKGGIKALVYLCAFAAPAPNLSLTGILGLKDDSQHPDWWDPKNGQVILNGNARAVLYDGVDDAVADMYMTGTVPQGFLTFKQPCKHAASDVTAPKIFIAGKLDKAISYDAQVSMAGAAGAELISVDSGHSPFAKAGQAARVRDIIISACE
ncbi:Alpha/beta hydrolase fold-1 [Xylariales sp. PMI_506]|nr:Alpha/beta hydrolase fold-1 [Xylariales sp. PMI_506]